VDYRFYEIIDSMNAKLDYIIQEIESSKKAKEAPKTK